MVKNNKKPRLRFKGFTDEWEQRKLGDIGKTYTGLSGKNKEDFGHGIAQYITYMNIFSNPIANVDGVENIEIDYKQNKVNYGDVFFTTSSETPEEVGISSVWFENTQNTYLNSFCFGYRLNDYNAYNLKFLAYLFRGSQFRKNMILLAQGISRYNISKNKVMDINIKIPKQKIEQTKIGEFFYNLDNLITLHQRKYDKLLNVKKALLDKMFPKNQEKTPKIRFKGFFDAWEQRKLGEIVEFYSGLTYKPNDIVDDDKETLVLRSCNVQNGEIIENDNVYVTSGVVNSKNVSQGDIIVVVRNGSRDLIGKHAVIKRNMLKTVIGAFMTGISSKYPNFVNSLLSTNQFFIEIEKNLGATINQITTGNFAKMNFTIPIKFDEKIKIGKMFLILDNLITLHQSKCEKLKNIKKALLDKMFV